MTMKLSRENALAAALMAIIAACLIVGRSAQAATAQDIDRDSDQAIQTLYSGNPVAAEIGRQALGVLVFPNIVKAGFIFGAGYGEGELKQGPTVQGYYNSFTGSWGLQAGVQSYSYAVFLMTDSAIRYIDRTHGLEIGVGPTVVVLDKGAAKNISSSTLKDDAYAFIFNQQGLMAGISIEGTKISRIVP